jgi:RND family efflux transporter MFP subunit
MKTWVKVILPIGILLLCGVITVTLVKLKKKPERQPVKKEATLVEVTSAKSQSWTFSVKTQGTVEPRTKSALTAEVSGRILKISPTFYAGGFFNSGDILLEIDPSNYKSAVARAEFNLAQARLKLAQEEANSRQARKEWESLSDEEPTPLVLRQPQLQSEQANVTWAEQALDKAKLDLSRTMIRAPYAGMVREKKVDLGQYVTIGTQLGAIFSIDIAEVRLPLSLDQLAYLEIQETYRGDSQPANNPKVTLSSSIGEIERTWTGYLTRTEGVIDSDNRMIYAIAQVNDPYGYLSDHQKPPLKMGLFVHANISGKTVDDVIVLPRLVLRGQDQILVVDEQNHLRSKTVKIIQADEKEIIISEGVEPGAQVSLTALEFVVDGMEVKIQSDKPADQKKKKLPSVANTEKRAKKES